MEVAVMVWRRGADDMKVIAVVVHGQGWVVYLFARTEANRLSHRIHRCKAWPLVLRIVFDLALGWW